MTAQTLSIRTRPQLREFARRSSMLLDRWLLATSISLILLGLIMVASASVVISEKNFQAPFHFLFHQATNLLIGVLSAVFLLKIELTSLQKYARIFLLVTMVLLVLVLIPGIGRVINGSSRWIGVGGFGMQVSELAKFFIIIYLADFLVRYEAEVRTQVQGFLKPMLLISLIAFLLLKEPDFGAATVIMATALAMMFMAGVRVWQFLILLAVVLGSLALLAVSSPYRLERLTAFLNPWANQFDSGYQLTQSLIAFGRGGWSGVGLGESIQKLFYLPEAHTDFVFAVFAEEMGLMGVILVLILFIVLVARAFWIGRKAYHVNCKFSAYIAYGFGLWIGMQAIINMGVNCGLFPTKGLTLPFISYGGSSLIIMCWVLALLLRIDFENRIKSMRKVRVIR